MLRAAAGLSPPGSSQQQRRIPCHTQPLQCPCPLLLALLRGLPVRPAPTGTQGVALVASGSPWTKSPEGCTPHPRHSPLPSCSQPFAERAAFTPNLFFFFFPPNPVFSPRQLAARCSWPDPAIPHTPVAPPGLGVGGSHPGSPAPIWHSHRRAASAMEAAARPAPCGAETGLSRAKSSCPHPPPEARQLPDIPCPTPAPKSPLRF